MKNVLAVIRSFHYSLGMTIQVQSTAEIHEMDQELTFEFSYRPAEKGSRDQYGQKMEPDLEESLEFWGAFDEDGAEIEIEWPEDIEAARVLAFNEIHNR
jgi:hypothetical protein